MNGTDLFAKDQFVLNIHFFIDKKSINNNPLYLCSLIFSEILSNSFHQFNSRLLTDFKQLNNHILNFSASIFKQLLQSFASFIFLSILL